MRHSIKNYIQSEGDISKLQDTLNELLEKNEWNVCISSFYTIIWLHFIKFLFFLQFKISVNEDNIIIDRFHSETELYLFKNNIFFLINLINN